MTSKDQLLLCPMCGSEVKLISGFEPIGHHFIDCDTCGLSGKLTDTADQSIAAWNRRAKVDAVQVRNDALEASNWALESAAIECEAAAMQYEREARGGDNSGASDHKADAARSLAEDIRRRKQSPVAAMPPEGK